MKTSFLSPILFACCLIGFHSLLSRAEAPPSLTPEEAKEGFVPLFNNKDLTGFKEVQGRPGAFRVEDGVLIGRREGGHAYWLSTENKYGDFELRLQYMLKENGNSGIFVRVPNHIGRTSARGMEIQLQDDSKRTGKPTEKDTGSIYRVSASTKFVSRKPGEWNDLAIKCEGSKVKVTHNGELINDFDMDSREETKNRPREGFIGLSAHTDDVRFRNIRIHVLK